MMNFNTLGYFLILPIIFLIHHFSPAKFRWMVLLVASFCFYVNINAPHLIAILLSVTTVTYFTGIWLDRNECQATKRYILWGGVFANILTLVILKYLPFLTTNLNLFLNFVSPGSEISVCKEIIVIGASYFIFQAISYLIDIYLEFEKPERHFGYFALYMSFFPKLLQGPIERGGDLLPQFKVPYVFNYDNVRAGMLLFALGLLKKAVIADRLAIMVNPVFDNVYSYNGLPLLLATYYYALQIYFDFSGYTDMALGTAMMFNINLTQNFNNPYFARSIADFWRRWHISFSRWILDYIFKPLQMSWRNWGNWGVALALMTTFTISGIWHGASWGFVIWGVLHGIYMALSVPIKGYRKKLLSYFEIDSKSTTLKFIEVLFTFNLVSITWVFFRANTLSDAVYVLKNLVIGVISTAYGISIKDLISGKLNLSLSQGLHEIIVLCFFIPIITVINNTEIFKNIQKNQMLLIRWSYYMFIISAIMLLGFFGRNTFIYTRF